MIGRRMFSAMAALFFCETLAFAGEAIPNWAAPATWSPSRSPGRVAALDVTNPLPFIGLAPCRILDTRGNGFSGAYGAPALVASASRNFPLSGQCGIPSGAGAVSLNVTVTNAQGPGFILMYPQGGTQPLVSTLNYVAGQTVANAAVVPLGTGGGVSVVAGVSGTDLVIDTNGYYAGNVSLPFAVTINSNSLPGIQVTNLSGSCSSSCGVVSQTTSTSGGDAIAGLAFGTSGTNYGVRGFTQSISSGTAGVFGFVETRATAPSNYLMAGVRGEAISGHGVLGVSQSSGVGAALVDAQGNGVIYALLAAKGPVNYAVFGGGDFGGTGAKYFIEPHPTDASKVIRYVSLEGREAGTYFRGRGRFERGWATIEVPEDFRMVTDSEGLSIQVTPIGGMSMVSVARIGLEGILIEGSRDVEFFFTVNGVRKTHKHLKPIGPGNEFVPQSAEATVPLHLTAGQKAMLVSNGTYNTDGTVNMETAERLGWTKAWTEREAKSREAAAPRKVEPDQH